MHLTSTWMVRMCVCVSQLGMNRGETLTRALCNVQCGVTRSFYAHPVAIVHTFIYLLNFWYWFFYDVFTSPYTQSMLANGHKCALCTYSLHILSARSALRCVHNAAPKSAWMYLYIYILYRIVSLQMLHFRFLLRAYMRYMKRRRYECRCCSMDFG